MYVIALCIGFGSLTSCSSKKEENTTSQTQALNSSITTKPPTEVKKTTVKTAYKYVTAPNGLSLREYNNLQSDKLSVMPYGTRVEVISPETQNTMTVSGIKGAMDYIAYNHKKGYAFNGYLSNLFPPEKNSSAKSYAEELKEYFPKAKYTKVTSGKVSQPITTETLDLPTNQWHEAYFVAQQLFAIPNTFSAPSLQGKDNEVIQEDTSRDFTWKSELQVSRNNDVLTKIKYIYKNKGIEKSTTLTKSSAGINIVHATQIH